MAPPAAVLTTQLSPDTSASNAAVTDVAPRVVSPDSPPRESSRDVITYIFPDFNAVKYFQRDFIAHNEFHIVEETTESGFDIYLVEQWVHNRKIGSVVSTFTGNPKSTVSVIKFTVIKKLSRYYPARFQEYLNELMINHAKVKVIEKVFNSSVGGNNHSTNEVLFVTNLSTLPSNLNLISIQCGDPRVVEDNYYINSNLKKLHCSGRSLSMVTDKVSVASEDKFRQMYKVFNVQVPVKFAIKEVINLIQICLFYFDLLDAKYCDGFLCNKTEEAIINWWNLIGLPHFSIKPNPKNGILPSRAVAAIISFVISIKLRLHLVGGCDPPKDPFDFENFMISIGQFQKQYKLEKRRKLDLETLNKLFTLTNALKNSTNNNSIANNPLYAEDYQSINSSFDTSMRPHNRIANPRYNSTNNSATSLGTNGGLHGSSTNLNGPKQSSASSGFHVGNALSTNGNSLSAYRKNKNYYSKEIKKLTNVVKNTVQDHIGAVNRGGDDANYYNNSSSSKSNGTRRIKKLSELNPIEVETLDLDTLVQNFLVGKKLFRLWFGAMGNGVEQKKDAMKNFRDNHVHQHPNNSQINASPIDNKHHYKFISLKDEITSTPASLASNGGRSEYSRYSRGLNKVKLGLQGRKGQNIREQLLENNMRHSSSVNTQDNNENVKNSTSLVDSLLGVEGGDGNGQAVCADGLNTLDGICEPDIADAKCKTRNKDEQTTIESFYYGLNRRNSFPFVSQAGELNLNLIENAKRKQQQKDEKNQVKDQQDLSSLSSGSASSTALPLQVKDNNSESKVENLMKATTNARRLVRSISFSAVDEFINSTQASPPLETIGKLSHTYLKSVSKLTNFYNMRRLSLGDNKNAKLNITINEIQITKSYAHLNLELIKLSNVHSKMQDKKVKIVDEDLLGNLDYKIGDLTSTIDRLVYETRIVVKRVNELEENTTSLQSNLAENCTDKLSVMIDKLICSAKFNSTFSNTNEREDLLFKLTGSKEPEILKSESASQIQEPYECKSLLQFFIICFYELVFGLVQILKFDRSKMNLDRIRGAWAKLDPNRTYINKAYVMIGKKPSKPKEISSATKSWDSQNPS